MAQRKVKESKNPILQALEMSSRLQDLYEYVAHRDLVFVEIPSSSFLVPRMEEEEVEDFAKTPIVRFYRGVHPLVLYVDNRIAVPVNSSLLQPYYSYLRYLVSTQPAVWAHTGSVSSFLTPCGARRAHSPVGSGGREEARSSLGQGKSLFAPGMAPLLQASGLKPVA